MKFTIALPLLVALPAVTSQGIIPNIPGGFSLLSLLDNCTSNIVNNTNVTSLISEPGVAELGFFFGELFNLTNTSQVQAVTGGTENRTEATFRLWTQWAANVTENNTKTFCDTLNSTVRPFLANFNITSQIGDALQSPNCPLSSVAGAIPSLVGFQNLTDLLMAVRNVTLDVLNGIQEAVCTQYTNGSNVSYCGAKIANVTAQGESWVLYENSTCAANISSQLGCCQISLEQGAEQVARGLNPVIQVLNSTAPFLSGMLGPNINLTNITDTLVTLHDILNATATSCCGSNSSSCTLPASFNDTYGPALAPESLNCSNTNGTSTRRLTELFTYRSPNYIRYRL